MEPAFAAVLAAPVLLPLAAASAAVLAALVLLPLAAAVAAVLAALVLLPLAAAHRADGGESKGGNNSTGNTAFEWL